MSHSIIACVVVFDNFHACLPTRGELRESPLGTYLGKKMHMVLAKGIFVPKMPMLLTFDLPVNGIETRGCNLSNGK